MKSSIVVTIYRSDLTARRACQSGLDIFESIREMQGRKRSVRVRWDALSQLWLATAHPEFCAWLRGAGLIPWLDLNRANLNGANLNGANLNRANLDGANLNGANLDGANLNGANLNRANLDGANLDGASLYGANLDGANLDGANLDGANLDGASLDGAYYPGGDLPPGWERDERGYLRRTQ